MKRVCAFSLAASAALWLFTGVVSAQGGAFQFGFAEAPSLPAPDLGPTQDAFDPMAFDCIENDGPDWPAGSLADHEGLPGATTLGAYYGTVEQLDGGVTTGAQGWQMSFQASGCDAAILSVTATQTGIADGDIASCENGPGGSGGFDATELTSDPPAGNAGAVHAIVLHLKKGTTLDPTASNAPPATGPEQNPVSVVRFLVTCNNPAVDGDTCDLTLAFVDGLAGSGQPIDNKVTQDGQSVVPAFANETITKTAMDIVIPPDPEFIRGDANDDGINNIADAIWILNGAFRNPPYVPAACEDASDANDDGFVDPIVEVAFILSYQFSAGMAPPPPFNGCGIDPTPDALNCAPGSMTECP